MQKILNGAILVIASLIGLGSFVYPFFVPSQEAGSASVAHAQDAPLIFVVLVLLCLAAVLSSLSSGMMNAKLIAILGILTAANAVLRGVPGPAGFTLVFILPILCGYAYGPTFGFLLGVFSLGVSAFLGFGVGPWLPYQMLATGWVGLLSGWLPRLKHARAEAVMLAIWGLLVGFSFGILMNIYFWPFVFAAGQSEMYWQPGCRWARRWHTMLCSMPSLLCGGMCRVPSATLCCCFFCRPRVAPVAALPETILFRGETRVTKSAIGSSDILTQTCKRIQPLDEGLMAAAKAHQDTLTKPAGSLGILEELGVKLAGITGQALPKVERKAVIVLAGDHGVVAEGVSAYPPEVTAQMVHNILRGGAAINVLARQAGARVVVADVGVAADLPEHPDLLPHKIARGTANMLKEPAMSRDQAVRAVEIGVEIVTKEVARGLDLVATGEMGIGNTTPASAITAAYTGLPVAQVTGRGTGVDSVGLARKVDAIESALALHQPDPRDAFEILAAVGGFEIGGIAGVCLGAAAHRLPVIVDGFISTAGALIASRALSSGQTLSDRLPPFGRTRPWTLVASSGSAPVARSRSAPGGGDRCRAMHASD